MPATVVTLACPQDAYNFVKGDDNSTWRIANWRDRLRWWVRAKLRLGRYTRCVAVDHERGVVTCELIRWSWLRMRWVTV